MSDHDLEHALSAAIRELPEPQAPLTLLPRVMGAVRARERRPWYVRPLSTWPPLAQAGVVTACLLLMVATFTFAMPALAAVTHGLDMHTTTLAPVIEAVRNTDRLLTIVTTLASTLTALWPRLCGPLVGYAALLLVLLGSALGALGSTLHHFTQQEV
jgi:hypothetical protein